MNTQRSDVADHEPLPPGGAAPLLRIDEVARRLSISRSKAWLLVATHEIPAVRIGRSIRVKPADLEAFIEAASDESD